MARRKKKTVKRRRSRVGAMALNPASPMVKIGSALLGFFLSKPINDVVNKVAGSLDPKIVAGVQVGLGGMYLLSKGKKNLLLTAASGIVAGAGVKRAMTAFGIGGIGGYGQVSVLNGYGQVPALGYAKSRMNGYTPQGNLGGYAPQGTLQGANVMGGVGNGTGSDLIREGGSSLMG